MIEGVLVEPRGVISSAQGAALHFLRSDAPEFTQFGEVYFSEVFPGVDKAWRIHRHSRQSLTVPTGRARFTLFDERPESSTCGETASVELGRPDAYQLLVIPPGVWYRFVAVSETPALIANCRDVPHVAGESEQRSADDPRMPRS